MVEKAPFTGKTFRYRLKLTKEQEVKIDEQMKTCRWLYNTILDYCIHDYKYAKNNALNDTFGNIRKIELGYPYINYNLEYLKIKIPNEAYKLGGPVRNQGAKDKITGVNRSTYAHYVWLKSNAHSLIMKENLNKLPAVVAQDILNRVGVAFDNFFKGNGYPKFKKSSESCNITIAKSKTDKSKTLTLENDILILPEKIGNAKIIKHRDLPKNSLIKRASITKSNTGKYFINISVEYDDKINREFTKKIIAIDRNIKLNENFRDFGTWYDGTDYGKISMPAFNLNEFDKVKRIQQKMSEVPLHSERWLKLQTRKRHLEEHIFNRKKNWMHQLTANLVKNYDYIILEDLNITDMTNKEKAKSKAARADTKHKENEQLKHSKQIRRGFNEINHGETQVILEQKALPSNVQIIKINPSYTSKQCHICNHINHNLDLGMREWECPNCHTIHDRDINAAYNIYSRGLENIQKMTG
jgi:putative transposase